MPDVLCKALPLLLFDEPDSSLDVNNRYHMMQVLRRLADEEKLGALLVLHDPQLALAYCDKVYLLKGGKICAEIEKGVSSADTVEKGLRQVFSGIKVYENEGNYFWAIVVHFRWKQAINPLCVHVFQFQCVCDGQIRNCLWVFFLQDVCRHSGVAVSINLRKTALER